MNYAPREFSHEPPDSERTKAVLFGRLARAG